MSTKEEFSRDILYFHILPRLPAKSLGRFRFVSKQWQSFISTPVFTHMHLHHHQNHHKLLLLSHKTFRTIDCANPDKDIDCVINYLFEGVIYDWCSVVASLHGMVCLRTVRERYILQFDSCYLVLWNPFTGEYKRLSEAGFPKDGHSCSGYGPLIGLYYTSSDDDYKLLLVNCYRNPYVYIYSLKSDSWRQVDYLTKVSLASFDNALHYGWKRGTTALLNEKLYFLVQRGKYESPSYSIIRFDTKTEKLTEIATPAFPGNTANCLSILVERGCTQHI